MACGPVKSASDGTVEEVVAVGGYNGEVELGEYLSVVEIYNFAQASWRAGRKQCFVQINGNDSRMGQTICISAKDLPFGKIAYSTAVPHDSTFLLVGGEFYEGADATYYDTVYR